MVEGVCIEISVQSKIMRVVGYASINSFGMLFLILERHPNFYSVFRRFCWHILVKTKATFESYHCVSKSTFLLMIKLFLIACKTPPW